MAACQEQNAAVCTRVFACTPAANRDAAFLASFGPTVAECEANLNVACANASSTCPTYNSALAATCISKINATTCATVMDPNAAFPVECGLVCSGTGTGGTGGTGGGGALTTAGDFCDAIQSVTCDQLFACVPAAMRDATFVSSFGSTAAECKAMAPTVCATAAADCQTYSSATAASCVSTLQTASCTAFGNFATTSPPACTAACPGQF
jgi:hypothetical protein